MRHAYTNSEMDKDRGEAFERKWRRHEFAAQPQITAVDLDVELVPRERRALASVDYLITNRTDADPAGARRLRISGEGGDPRGGGRFTAVADEAFNHYVLAFEVPMQPGEVRRLSATVDYANPGFRNSGNNSDVRRNGTFFNSTVLPQLNWGVEKILTDRAERRKRGLPEDPRMPALEDERYWRGGLLPGADWIEFRAEITTDADQIAMAPGYLVSDSTEGAAARSSTNRMRRSRTSTPCSRPATRWQRTCGRRPRVWRTWRCRCSTTATGRFAA